MSARRFSKDSLRGDNYRFGQRRSNKNMNAMPGPEFNDNPSEKGWFARHSQKIVLSLIVILLIVGGYYFYKSYQQRQALLRPALESIVYETPSASNAPSAAPTAAAAPAQPKVTAAAIPEVQKQGSDFVARAAKGDGATHLARQTLKEYLKDKSDLAGQLKAEQKIYIEDYLQKHVSHANVLKVGDAITFSDSLIDDAVTQAQKLTDKQINNLHKYVLLAPSL